MNCWNCGNLLSDLERKTSFRAICDKCYAGLHCCSNCQYYSTGRPNDCAVPGTEPISDRSANNFCEEFKFLGKPPEKNQNANKFDDLFK